MPVATKRLYWEDAYQKEFSAKVLSVSTDALGRIVAELDQTCFFPQGGGQVGDTGVLGGTRVVDTQKTGDWRILHVLESAPSFSAGTDVQGVIDWERRHKIMRLHSATHVVYYLFKKVFGEQYEPDASGLVDDKKDRTDWVYPERLDPVKLKQLEDEANGVIANNYEVKTWTDVENGDVRFWQIEPFPAIKCGGTHVKNTSEIGKIRLKREKKAAGKERVEIYLLE